MQKRLGILMILDGWGITDKTEGNALVNANKPNFDMLWRNYPHTQLNASGLDVGLPEGQMGNSEVGHLNIGSGRIIYQEFTRINKEIEEGRFFQNNTILDAIKNAKEKKSQLHILGLLSDGGVHSHINHLKALIKLCKEYDLDKVYIHGFLDGRDVPPQSALTYIKDIEEYVNEIGIGEIASISGRYYAMDRDKRWERVELAYKAMVLGEGKKASSAIEAVNNAYSEDITDEFVIPTVIVKNGENTATIKENDSVIFFNFRPDRAREITRAIVDTDFQGFERSYFKTHFVCLTQYDKTIENVNVAYTPQSYKNTFGEYISNLGYKQLRIAETEKYAHVTFFFNGGVEAPNKEEERILIPSPKVATYDLQPEMSAYLVTDKVIEAIEKDEYDFIILNFANPDMVGHTGVFEAAVSAVEHVDKCIGKIYEKVKEKNGSLFVTADHGNLEQMIDYETKEPYTAHTTNPVPFIVVNEGEMELRDNGRLSDIIPTILELSNIKLPVEMTGKSLVKGRR